MKKLSFVKAFLAASALALIVPGCSDFGTDENNVGQTAPSGKVALKVNIGNGYDSLRTALPSAESIALSQYTYSLLAESTEKAYIFGSAESGVAYSTAVSPKAAYIDKGTYNFVLTAFDASGKAILAGALNKEITEENNTLAFKLYAATENAQEGTVAITVNYPTDMGVTVLTAKLYGDAGCSGDGTELAVNGTGENGALEEGKRLVSGEISAGESFVKITLSDGTEELGSVTEAVYAVEGMVSSSNIAVEAEKFLGTVKLLDATIGTAKEIKVKAVINGTEKGNFISLDKISSDNKTYQAYLTAGLSYNVYVGDVKKDGVVISDVTEKEFYAEKDLSGIEIAWAGSSAPTDLYVNQIDLNDVLLELINVTKKYSNNETDEPVLASTISGAAVTVDATSTAAQIINVTVDGKTAGSGLDLTLNEDEIDSIAIIDSLPPTKTSYMTGDEINLAGMSIEVTWKSKNVTTVAYTVGEDGNSSDFAVTGFSSAKNVETGTQTITITYKNTASTTLEIYYTQVLSTEDSWDFTGYAGSIWNTPDVTGSLVQKDSQKYTNDGTYTLSSDATVVGADGKLNLTLIASTTQYSYRYGVHSGLRFKNNAIKIADVKGNVQLVIEWECITGKAAGERNLQLTIGDNGVAETIPIISTVNLEKTANSEAAPMPTIIRDISAGNGTNIYIGASNNLYIKSITIVDPDKIQSAPNKAKFTSINAALNADDGKITVSELLTNENGAKLEYKLSSANEWTEATASIENLAAGVYEFRYAALSDGSKSASPSVSVTVFGAKSLELDSALYTITPKADGGVGSATTTIATAELSEGKVSVKSVAAGSSVITITDTYGNSEELTVTVSAIGTITAKSTKALGKIKATDSVAVTSSGESPLTVAKDDEVILTATPTIAAANPEKLTYQWYSKVGDEEVSEIDGATSATYTVPTSDAGIVFYSVKVKGTISTNVELTSEKFSVTVVDSLTKITDETVVTISSSAESSVEEGTKITLTASINGYDANSWEAVTYQWYKKVGEAEAVAIESATSVTYEYTTTADDVTASPTFIVKVTGASSDVSVTSSAVTISVEKKRVDVQKSQTINNDEAQLGFVATSVESSDGSVATVEITEDGIVITSVTAGETTITCSADGKEATIAVTVKQTGDITIKVTKYRNITALVAVDEGSYNVTQTGIFVTNSAGTDKQSTDSRFLASCQINNSGLNLKGEDYPVFFRVESKMILTFTDSNSKGLVIYEVTGSGKKKSETALENKETAPKYKYELPAGMYEIVGTSAGTGKIASLNFESAVFTAKSETVENSESKLGLVATGATSSDTGVVTVSVNNGIVITSVAKGSATITCKDAEDHEATIAVTVSGSGAITVGTITKYVDESTVVVAETATLTFNSNSALSAVSEGITFTVSGDGMDFFPSTGKVKVSKVNKNFSIKFTTLGTTSNKYSMVISYFNSQTEASELTVTEKGASSGTKIAISASAGVQGAKSSLNGATVDTPAVELAGGTEYTITRSGSKEFGLVSLTLTKTE